MASLKMKSVERGLYKRGDVFYDRVRIDGKNTFRALASKTITEARRERDEIRLKHEQAKAQANGRLAHFAPVEDPYAPKKAPKPKVVDVPRTMAELCDTYITAGMPRKNRSLPEGQQAEFEKKRAEKLKAWDDWGNPENITQRRVERYAAWRKTAVFQPDASTEGKRKRKNTTSFVRNGRIVDLELRYTLKNVLRHAHRTELIKQNPMLRMDLGKFQKGKSRHAKENAPLTAEELHALAKELLDNPKSTVLGFQMLFEAFTGVRTCEALACRWDAKPGSGIKWAEAGFISGDHLHLNRAKGGVNPWAKIHPALRDLLDVMRRWNAYQPEGSERTPSSWFFPGKVLKADKPADNTALAHALDRIVKAKIAKKEYPEGTRRNSHGMRAFYVGVRRSQGAGDGEIAAEIGDASGAPLIVKHYGPVPPNWMDQKEGKTDFLPKDGKPAWTDLAAKLPANLVPLSNVA